MRLEHIVIPLPEEARVPDLHRIGEIGRKFGKEHIELPEKFVRCHVVTLELKEEWPRVGAELGISIGLQDQLVEGFGVEKLGFIWPARGP